MINFQAPIINIGLGRSGSTLLSALLNSHTNISFASETNYATFKLWKIFLGPDNDKNKDNQFLEWRYIWDAWAKKIHNSGSITEKSEYLKNERKRLSNLIAKTMIAALEIDYCKAAWGFKEIWNGSDLTEKVDWSIYDEIFPDAYWVHLVRNPLNYSISATHGDITKFSSQLLRHAFKDWVQTVTFSRLRRCTGKFFEIRYEDLINDPKETLRPLFSILNLKWTSTLEDAFKINYCSSKSYSLDNFLPRIKGEYTCPGLIKITKELGYYEYLLKHGIILKEKKWSDTDNAFTQILRNPRFIVDEPGTGISAWEIGGLGKLTFEALNFSALTTNILKISNLTQNDAALYQDIMLDFDTKNAYLRCEVLLYAFNINDVSLTLVVGDKTILSASNNTILKPEMVNAKSTIPIEGKNARFHIWLKPGTQVYIHLARIIINFY